LVKKFFPLDKNYLLEQAQQMSLTFLLSELVEKVKDRYELKINPLGLEDSFSTKIKNYKLTDHHSLLNFYETVAAIYRFKFGHNQLEFLWDGTDHLQHYQTTWRQTFAQWTNAFCQHDLFIQAVLDLTVFLPEKQGTQMIENRMNYFILKHFDVKIHKSKGIMVA
jgi:hypothetical protein